MKYFIMLSILLGLQAFAKESQKDQVDRLREMKQELIELEKKIKISDNILSLYDSTKADSEKFLRYVRAYSEGIYLDSLKFNLQDTESANYGYQTYYKVDQAMQKNSFQAKMLIEENETLKSDQKLKRESFYELKRKLGFELDEEFESNTNYIKSDKMPGIDDAI